MRRALTAALVVLVALVLAAPASSTTPTVKQLQAQVNTLKKQVKTLQTSVKNAQVLAAGAILYTGCSDAVIADTIQGTWTQYLMKPDPGNVNDYGACSTVFKVTRQPNTPTLTVFQQVIDLFLKH